MSRIPPPPPPTDEYGLSKYQRLEIRQAAIQAAAEALSIDMAANCEGTARYIVNVAKDLEYFIVSGKG
jgi:hypothetical protein